MNRPHIILVVALLLMVVPGFAQRGKKKVVAKQPKIEIPVEDPKFTDMLEATQQIVFVDSVVVDKHSFLNWMKLNQEAGTVYTYNQFFGSEQQPYSIVYVNQLANKCWYSKNGKLYTSDLLGKQWSEPTALEGLGHFEHANYPFVLADGTTLYFAAISEEGLGGLDIYVSRYDSETGRYLQAENIGLPFNSDANDYMYAIDELDSIGYFATDRRQPEGSVCIYTFIPNQSRHTYSADDYDEETIRKRAAITRIADTWGDGKARRRAVKRLSVLREMTAKPIMENRQTDNFVFIVNDMTVYTQMNDFRVKESQELMAQLLSMQKKASQISNGLEKARTTFAKASATDKKALLAEITAAEKQHLQLQKECHDLEKRIRILENKQLK